MTVDPNTFLLALGLLAAFAAGLFLYGMHLRRQIREGMARMDRLRAEAGICPTCGARIAQHKPGP